MSKNMILSFSGEEEDSEDMVDQDEEELLSSGSKSECLPFEPQAKRKRKYSADLKKCSAKGCQKSHLWSKKWVTCPKCKKELLPGTC